MTERLWSYCLLIAVVVYCTAEMAQAAHDDSSNTIKVRQLIVQLGDDQYVLRQQAETHLLERGVEAFAELQAAENHADLEIATRAKYILNQISIDWVRPSDPPAVRSIMARYGELSKTSRLAKVAQLAKLESEQGFGALCRVARFESSGPVARYAALAILEKGFLSKARTAAAISTLNGELGESTEAPQSWVQVYVDQLQAAQQIDPRWLELIDAEISLLAMETAETNESMALTLLQTYLELCDQLSDAEAIMAGLQRRIELGANSDEAMSASLIDAITWLVAREQWNALELLEDRYTGSMLENRVVLYHLAVAREQQGRPADAEKLAEKALQFEVEDLEERNEVANIIAELGHHDWAEREWKSVIHSAAATHFESLTARESLGLFRLHDRQEHRAAAEILTESIEAIENDPAIKADFQSDPNSWAYLTRARSNREFFLACHFESEGDYGKQRQHLEQAYKLERDNADIVIALYHLREASDVQRKVNRQRLASAKNKLEKSIKQLSAMSPRTSQVKRVLAGQCNHFAWLVSNTEGDVAKAVERSKLSLELDPGNASYLDTLGRCYYAAGDLENAVKVQREAIAKHPYLLVMRRQLKLFEDELQKRSGRDVGKPR